MIKLTGIDDEEFILDPTDVESVVVDKDGHSEIKLKNGNRYFSKDSVREIYKEIKVNKRK